MTQYKRMIGKRSKIGLLDHLGYGNLGDDSTLLAVMQQIKNRWPRSEIIGLSLNADDTETRLGIPSCDIRRLRPNAPPRPELVIRGRVKRSLGRHVMLFDILRGLKNLLVRPPCEILGEILFLFRAYSVTRSLDILVICGGGQLLDSWGGAWQFPFTIFKWVLLAKLSGARCYIVNVGAGPLDRPLSKWLIRQALYLADYITFRDDQSRRLIHDIGFRRGTHSVADSVYAFEVPEFTLKRGRRSMSEAQLAVGISPMAFCDPRRYWKKDQAMYERYIRNLGLFCARLAKQRHTLHFFSTELWWDSYALADLEIATREAAGPDISVRIRSEPINDVYELLERLSLVDVLITCRFHGVVFAQLMNVPVLAIAHHPKVTTVMSDFGLSEYCVDIHHFDDENSHDRFSTAIN